MKIALIGPTYPFRGGLAHFTTLLVRALRERHTVRFYSYTRQYPQWLFPGSTAADPSATVLDEPCERIIDSLNPLTYWRVARNIVADTPDLLLLQWWTPFWLPLHTSVALAARRAGIPVLYLCHQLVEPDSGAIEWQAARAGLALADAFVVMTEGERQRVAVAFPGRPTATGYHPVYDQFPASGVSRAVARMQLNIPKDASLLLFFGFVRRYKGLSVLLDALALARTPVHLLVVGEFWEDETATHTQIARLGLQDRVRVENRYVPNEAIEPYFAATDALVLPYLSGSQSGVAMIAVQYTVPVIASDVGGLGETIRHGENGLLVPPADPAALAGAIDALFAADQDAMRAAMAATRARLAWPALVDVIEETAFRPLRPV